MRTIESTSEVLASGEPTHRQCEALRGDGSAVGATHERRRARGKVYLVGAGPGAADLVTVRAARVLERADIVFHDALVGADVLDLAPRAIRVAVGKRRGAHSTSQRFINKRLVDAASRHGVVVRLKGGDPMLFGRAAEELGALASAGIDVEVVPGVTAALAAAADLALPLTERGRARSVAFVTPRVGEGERGHDWARVARTDTVVLYMAAGESVAVVEGLVRHGWPVATPVAVVENAGTPGVRSWTGALGNLPALAARADAGPALIVVGNVCASLTRLAARRTARAAAAA